jgi:hypothetical protein
VLSLRHRVRPGHSLALPCPQPNPPRLMASLHPPDPTPTHQPWRPSLEQLFEDYFALMPAYQGLEGPGDGSGGGLERLTFLRLLFGVFPTFRGSPLQPGFDRCGCGGWGAGAAGPSPPSCVVARPSLHTHRFCSLTPSCNSTCRLPNQQQHTGCCRSVTRVASSHPSALAGLVLSPATCDAWWPRLTTHSVLTRCPSRCVVCVAVVVCGCVDTPQHTHTHTQGACV